MGVTIDLWSAYGAFFGDNCEVAIVLTPCLHFGLLSSYGHQQAKKQLHSWTIDTTTILKTPVGMKRREFASGSLETAASDLNYCAWT